MNLRPMKRVLCLTLLAAAGCGTRAGRPDAAHYIFPSDYMADPSARLFDGRLYIYPSHDRISKVTDRTDGNHYDMKDYHVLTMDSPAGEAADCGQVLSLEEVPWASRQLWAPDAARRDGRYYLYFPAKDSAGVFRIGAAVADRPEGPFTSDPRPIAGTYSIDPAVFEEKGAYYLYFGGLQGGQLQRWRDNELLAEEHLPRDGEPALAPRVARLADDMRSLAEPSRPVEILTPEGGTMTAADPHRFFEAAWLHKYGDTYYFSYSTGSHHTICYATGSSPYGPFVYRGVLLTPVVGWTTHHSIVEWQGRWWLFYHDSAPSGGVSSLRSLKIAPIEHLGDGTIRTIEGKEGHATK